MIKVGLLLQSFENGGVQRVMINLNNGFIKNNLKTNIIVADNKGAMKKNVCNNTEIYDLNANKYKGDYKFLFSINKLREYIEKEKPNAIIACPGFSSIALLIANMKSKYKTKTILIVDNKLSILKKGKLKHKISYFIYKKMYNKADRIITAHDNAKNDLLLDLKIDKCKLERIYHPLININEITEKRDVKHRWFNLDNYILLSVGRLVPEKSFDNLIRAFYHIKINKLLPENIKLIIVGDGEEKNKLCGLVSELKLNDSVDLFGYSDAPFEFMKNSNMYVSSSSKEAFGNVIVEALACGMKVVATDCESGGPREILENGKYGELCQMNNVQDLEEKILICYSKKYNKDELINRGMYFSISNSVNQYIKIIEKVCEDDQ